MDAADEVGHGRSGQEHDHSEEGKLETVLPLHPNGGFESEAAPERLEGTGDVPWPKYHGPDKKAQQEVRGGEHQQAVDKGSMAPEHDGVSSNSILQVGIVVAHLLVEMPGGEDQAENNRKGNALSVDRAINGISESKPTRSNHCGKSAAAFGEAPRSLPDLAWLAARKWPLYRSGWVVPPSLQRASPRRKRDRVRPSERWDQE